MSPAPVSRFAPRTLVNIPSTFSTNPGYVRQSSNPASLKNIQDFVKQALGLQRSNSLVVKPKPAEHPESNFKSLLNQDEDLTIGSRLAMQKQDSAPVDSIHNLTTSNSISLPSLNPDMMRSQSLKLTDRSNAFKLYARPLFLNQASDEKALSEKSLSPF